MEHGTALPWPICVCTSEVGLGPSASVSFTTTEIFFFFPLKESIPRVNS